MLALRLPLRLAARAAPSHARLASPIVASSLSATREYRTKADGSADTKKPTKKTTKKSAAPISKSAQKKADAKAAYKLLSPEEKAEISATAKEAKKKEDIKLLKAQALAPPKYRQVNLWSIYIKENLAGKTGNGQATEHIKALAQDFRNITSREREHLNHLMTEHNAKSLREFQEWLNSHTPAQIKVANQARARLRKLGAEGKKSQFAPIKDARLLKRPSGPYLHYHMDRLASGDFRNVSTIDASKDISVEFKALSASEKKKYEDLAAKGLEKYLREHLEVYGYESPLASKPAKKALAEADAGVEPST
ncbi:hypothetical protein M436DRAFT_45427 [Aureobasidium namibiae CBS 147.97]|uniref:HMG box domain-containing protein n=1 Tax=Aureobasidium namibiae CBS 147.97 TaxID=1043004 RepID=A0A074WR15_9PEZI